ncbi:MAG: hypothetical protein H0U76_25860 [Ktedonobacteraceae bacterium]|nr:hypothetical protein [Ktedonobacteraceae bacterium]
MGIFVLIVSVLLEVAGMAFSYWFGAHAFGLGNMWAATINDMVAVLPGLHRYHIHITASTIGLFWLAGNMSLHTVAIVAYIKNTVRKRAMMGNPGMREIQAVDRALRQLVMASPSGNLAPIPNFGWPLTFDYEPGFGMAMYFLGRKLVVGEGLFKSPHLKPLLAYELGHYNASDVDLREILACLPPAMLVLGAVAGLPLGVGLCLTSLFWPWYWRQRIYAADLFAARLGQAAELIQALERVVHPREKRKNLLLREYPYVAERIDRLMRYSGMSSTQAQGQRQHQAVK